MDQDKPYLFEILRLPRGVLARKFVLQNSCFVKIFKKAEISPKFVQRQKTTRGRTDPAAPGLTASLLL